MLDQQKKRNQKPEIPDPVYDERLFPRRCRRVFREPESDQQIRRQSHALPPDKHHQIVVGQHQRQHEKHEQVQIAEKSIVAGVVPHVAHRVDVNQESDSRHHQQHHQRKLIEIESEIRAETPRANPVRQILMVGKRQRRKPQRNPQRHCESRPAKEQRDSRHSLARRLLAQKAVDRSPRQRQNRDQPKIEG